MSNSKKKTALDYPYSTMPLIKWLALLFVGLKLTGHIDWNWFFVLTPFYLNVIVVWSWVNGENRGQNND